MNALRMMRSGPESGEWVLDWARERGRISSAEYRELAGKRLPLPARPVSGSVTRIFIDESA